MNEQSFLGDNPEQQSRVAEFIDYHWNEVRSLRPADIVAGFSFISGVVEMGRHRDDPVRVVKGLAKTAFGVAIGTFYGSRR